MNRHRAAMDWTASPADSLVKVPTAGPQMAVFGDGAFEELVKVR